VTKADRIADNLNAGLHALLAKDDSVYFLGEDISDPYGGAFSVSKGLSSRFRGRVLSTPLSENAIMGVANGLALAGDKVIVEVMFGDFALLAADQLVNFAAKSVSMYGTRRAMPVIVRCPVGGGRGYGPTHSQSVQKHFIGVPDLAVYELTPFHDCLALLEEMLAREEPCLLFEDKKLYGARRWDTAGDELFRFGFAGAGFGQAWLAGAPPDESDCVVISTGGTAPLVLEAMRTLFLRDEIQCRLLVPARLHPFDLESIEPVLAACGRVVVVEESVAGGTWGAEVAARIYDRLWPELRSQVGLVHSRSSVIPAAPHLERDVLVQADTVCARVREAVRD
jgi:pyruvate/2-oxoglutarate/acetoin dehydrogenase E1 component